MKKIYHILPVFTEALWGGQQLREMYGYQSELSNIGECYNVIAMPNHLDCEVMESGEKLSVFYQNNQELFGCDTTEMPVRAAMAATVLPMSVQVHPDNDYALKHDGRLGKPDGILVLAGQGKVEFGHYAQSRDEFKELVAIEAWDKLLRYIEVKTGDFLNMPAGTLHALGANMVYFEYSQNADLTYRLYDYGRKQIDPKTGKARTTHVDKVVDCVKIPDDDTGITIPITYEEGGCEIEVYHDEPGLYSGGKIKVKSYGTFEKAEFYFLICLKGSGTVEKETIKGGETLFVPCGFGEITIQGEMEIAYISYQKKEGENA